MRGCLPVRRTGLRPGPSTRTGGLPKGWAGSREAFLAGPQSPLPWVGMPFTFMTFTHASSSLLINLCVHLFLLLTESLVSISHVHTHGPDALRSPPQANSGHPQRRRGPSTGHGLCPTFPHFRPFRGGQMGWRHLGALSLPGREL